MCNSKLVVLFCCVLIMVIAGCVLKKDSYEGDMQQRLADACVVSKSPWLVKVLDNNDPPISSEQPGDLYQVFVVFDIEDSRSVLPLPLVGTDLIRDILKKCYGITLPSEKDNEK